MTENRNDDTKNSDTTDFAERSEAPIDQLGRKPKTDSEQNPPLPDGGPTDGEHGTDNDPELQE